MQSEDGAAISGGWLGRRAGFQPGPASWRDKLFGYLSGYGVTEATRTLVRQELASELGIVVSLRTVERSASHLRREFAARALAKVRFETPPGRQLQIDFGQRRIMIEGEDPGRVFLFVATLGYSRRIYAAAFRHER